MRARLLERRADDINKVARILTKKRRAAAEYSDQKKSHLIRKTELKKDDLVLLYDTPRHIDMSRSTKLQYHWIGPYFIEDVQRYNQYRLREADGTVLKGIFSSNRLKHFVKDTDGYWEPVSPEEDQWTNGDEDFLLYGSDTECSDQKKETSTTSKAVEPDENWQVVDKETTTNIEVVLPSKKLEGYQVFNDL